MPTTYKILGQSQVTGSGFTVYTVPAATQTVCSTITFCNLVGSSLLYNLNVVPSGSSVGNENYIAHSSSLDSQSTVLLTIGVTMEAGDYISCDVIGANSASVSVFGSEIT